MNFSAGAAACRGIPLGSRAVKIALLGGAEQMRAGGGRNRISHGVHQAADVNPAGPKSGDEVRKVETTEHAGDDLFEDMAVNWRGDHRLPRTHHAFELARS